MTGCTYDTNPNIYDNTVKPVYKGHWRFMSSCPLYTGSNYIQYSLNGENETAHYRQWFINYIQVTVFILHFTIVWLGIYDTSNNTQKIFI